MNDFYVNIMQPLTGCVALASLMIVIVVAAGAILFKLIYILFFEKYAP